MHWAAEGERFFSIPLFLFTKLCSPRQYSFYSQFLFHRRLFKEHCPKRLLALLKNIFFFFFVFIFPFLYTFPILKIEGKRGKRRGPYFLALKMGGRKWHINPSMSLVFLFHSSLGKILLVERSGPSFRPMYFKDTKYGRKGTGTLSL